MSSWHDIGHWTLKSGNECRASTTLDIQKIKLKKKECRAGTTLDIGHSKNKTLKNRMSCWRDIRHWTFKK